MAHRAGMAGLQSIVTALPYGDCKTEVLDSLLSAKFDIISSITNRVYIYIIMESHQNQPGY